MGTAMKHPVPERVKLSFVIFDIRYSDALMLAIILNVSQIMNNEIIDNFTVTQFTKMMQYQTNQRNPDVL